MPNPESIETLLHANLIVLAILFELYTAWCLVKFFYLVYDVIVKKDKKGVKDIVFSVLWVIFLGLIMLKYNILSLDIESISSLMFIMSFFFVPFMIPLVRWNRKLMDRP